MDNEETHEDSMLGLIQAAKVMREMFIPELFSYYQAFIKAGFDKDQAFRLSRDYLTALFSNINGDKKDGY